MNERDYERCVEKGVFAENLFLEYMLDNGYEFIAGDINRKTINPDYFEECFSCRYIPPTNKRGSRLAFTDSNGKEFIFIMPDYLLNYKNNGERYLFDVKSRKSDNPKESKHKLIEYYGVSLHTGLPCFISLVVWSERFEGYNIYIDNVDKYVTIDELIRFEQGERFSEYVYFDLKNMWKFNKKAIKVQF